MYSAHGLGSARWAPIQGVLVPAGDLQTRRCRLYTLQTSCETRTLLCRHVVASCASLLHAKRTHLQEDGDDT